MFIIQQFFIHIWRQWGVFGVVNLTEIRPRSHVFVVDFLDDGLHFKLLVRMRLSFDVHQLINQSKNHRLKFTFVMLDIIMPQYSTLMLNISARILERLPCVDWESSTMLKHCLLAIGLAARSKAAATTSTTCTVFSFIDSFHKSFIVSPMGLYKAAITIRGAVERFK